MTWQSAHHLLLVGTYCAASVGHVYLVVPAARVGHVAPSWLALPKLAIALTTVIKIGALAVVLQIISSFTLLLMISCACAAFYATNRFQPRRATDLLEALNFPLASYFLVLTSLAVDVLTTSLILSFVSGLVQSVVSLLACGSILCSIWTLSTPSNHSIDVPQNHLLSIQHPLTNYYDVTKSILCDQLHDVKSQDQIEGEEPDYLLEFNEFLYNKRNLTLPLRSLLWTLRKPAMIIVALSGMVALIVCSQAILVYASLFLLVNASSSSLAAFAHNILCFGALYYAMAAARAKIQQFTTNLAIRLRTCILQMVAEKVFRLSQCATTDAGLNSFISTDLQAFLDCLSSVPVGLINMFEMCGSILGLTFVIGSFAYITFFSILVYFGYLAYAAVENSPFEVTVAEKRAKRLVKAEPIIRNLFAIKTLGLQSYYLKYLVRFHDEENKAMGKLREQLSKTTMSLFVCYSAFTLVVFCGLADRYRHQQTSAEHVFPVLMILAIIGDNIGKAKLSIASWTNFQYLQRLKHLLNREEIPLRFEEEIEINPSTQIRIYNMNSHAAKPDTVLLKGVNIELLRGDFALIYGEAGSGKTTFLQAILGEKKIASGSIHVADASLAYCGQDAWLPDSTIQACITGGNVPIDEARYRAAVRACRLSEEIARSDSTKIGPNGSYLSRADKAKMLLARAAYANASIVLLDDSFAAFDETESIDLARNLLNPTDGLLRSGKATVLLASHSFAVPALIDDVYCLATSQFIAYPASEDVGSSGHLTIGHALPAAGSASVDTILSAPSTTITTITDTKPLLEGKVVQDASLQRNVVFVWNVMANQAGCRHYILWLLCFTFLEGTLVFGTAAWPQFRLSMPLSVTLQLVLGPTYCWLGVKTWRVLDDLRLTFAEQSHKKVATAIMTSSPSCTMYSTPTQLLNLLGTDLDILNTSLTKMSRSIYRLGCLIFALILLFWSTNYSLASVLIILICIAVIEHAWTGASKHATECSDNAMQKVNAKFAEVTEGLAYIRGFGWEKQMLQQLASATQESEDSLRTALSLEPWFEMSMTFCWAVVATSFVAYAFCRPSQISPAMLGLGLLVLFALPGLTNDVLHMSMDIKKFVMGVDRIRRFMVLSDELNTAANNSTTKADENNRVLPEIELKNVQIGPVVCLDHRLSNAEQFQPQSIDEHGTISALLGLLGKSQYRGSIRVDNVEVRNLSSNTISKFISAIPKDPAVIPGTPENDLLLAQCASPELAMEPIDDFLVSILDKLDLLNMSVPEDETFESLVSEMQLSEGQIALLNLARSSIDALAKNTRIVVLEQDLTPLEEDCAEASDPIVAGPARSAVPFTSRPGPNDPWLTPRRAAPRPPPKPSATVTTVLQYDPSIFDADDAAEPSDLNPDGSRNKGKAVIVDALQDTLGEEDALASQPGHLSKQRLCQIYPGTFPEQDGVDEDADKDN